MKDRFEELLFGLGREFNLSLHVDKHHACSLQIPPLVIQMQLDLAQEKMFLFSKLIDLPPGKFRENVLTAALVSNGKPDPSIGILAYLAIENKLTLHQLYPLSILTDERLAGLVASFYDMGTKWKKAIEAGRAGPPEVSGPKR